MTIPFDRATDAELEVVGRAIDALTCEQPKLILENPDWYEIVHQFMNELLARGYAAQLVRERELKAVIQ